MGKHKIKVYRKRNKPSEIQLQIYFYNNNRFYDQREFFVRRISVAAKRAVWLFVYKRKT